VQKLSCFSKIFQKKYESFQKQKSAFQLLHEVAGIKMAESMNTTELRAKELS